MIDKVEIENAARENTEAYYEGDDISEYCTSAFKDGVNWFKENLWHDASEVPDRVEEILLEQEINGKKQHQAYMFNGASFFREHCRKCGVTRWLYIEDLMEGGE